MNVFNNRNIIAPSQKELWRGYVCFVAYLLVIPTVLSLCVPYFSESGSRAGFLFHLTSSVCNFLLVMILFRNFLFRSRIPFGLLLITCLFGFLGYRGLSAMWSLILVLAESLLPTEASNLNQNTVVDYLNHYSGYMLINVVVLAPVVEEVLFRGVIFAPLCKKNPLLAYVVSGGAFAMIHVLSYIGQQPGSVLLFSAAQYLPAAFVLCWSYQRTRSILAPIVLHGLMNLYSSILTMY